MGRGGKGTNSLHCLPAVGQVLCWVPEMYSQVSLASCLPGNEDRPNSYYDNTKVQVCSMACGPRARKYQNWDQNPNSRLPRHTCAH